MKIGKIWPYILLIIGSVVMIFPFVWMLSTSFKAPMDIFNLSIFPESPTLANYIQIIEESMFIKWFLNSIIIALITTISVLFFDTLVGYIIAKFSFVGRTVLFILILSTLMVPTEMLIIPWYMMSSDFGWADTYWGVLFPGLMTGFGVFLMRQFMEKIPEDLLNAARIDGMNEYAIFFKIAVPQVWPAISALGIFTFLSNWNAFLWPLIVIESASLRTLPVGLSFFSSGEAESKWHLIMTGATISVIPLILVFILLQRHIIKGITLTGMK
ncbi:carbohydrate ABC transporter permease [Aquibacillus saliphilus]|uniref:carbohydrate ABC transporter permease n=1 Tax=Aquibacillus saliphilus TaxID=1909422 RepID=UPI001CF08E9D|nr:carbohydrate ABC transporter permease [Aquibacillus saliphilus]